MGNLLFSVVTFLRLVPYTSYHKKIFNYSILLNTKKIKDKLNWKPTYNNEKMFEENYEYCFKNNDSNQESFSKKKANEGLINLLKRII